MARIITITSGKGGVGKTSISLNLSLALSAEGFKVCLLDADLGLANVSILTGIYPEKNLESVIEGQFSLNEIVIKDYQGIDIIPGSSGIQKITNLTPAQTDILINEFLDFENYDYFIFDTSAGIAPQVVSFCMASHEIILVVTCEPTSLTDAYSMLKVLSKHGYDCPVKIVLNQVKSGKIAKKAYVQLKETVHRFLPIKVEFLGVVISDKNVQIAVISQTPFFLAFPDTIASKCIKSIAEKLIQKADRIGDIPLEFFWNKSLSFLTKYNRSDQSSVLQKNLNPKENFDPKEVLSRIESSLSTLVEEVDDIKQLLENFEFIANKSKKESPEHADSKQYSLDFESWLKNKYK